MESILNSKEHCQKLSDFSEQIPDILERISDAVISLDTDWRYTYMNKKTGEIFGKDPQKMIGRCIWHEFPEVIGQEFYTACYKALETQCFGEIEDYYKPRRRWFDCMIYPSQRGLTIFFKDITERKRIESGREETLRLSEVKFEKLFKCSPDAILLTRMSDKLLVEVNDSACRIFGYEREELLGRSVDSLNFWVIPSDSDRFAELLKENGHISNFELRARRKSGEIRIGMVSSELIHLQEEGYILSIIRDITDRIRAEEAMLRKNEEYKRLNEEYSIVNKDLRESLERVQDMNVKLEKAKEKAEESDRLKTAFLQNMSHEIRTPMNAIMGFSDLLESNFEDKEALAEFTSIIKQRSSDLLEIINDLLDIAQIESRQLTVRLESCNLNTLFSEVEVFFNDNRLRICKQHSEVVFRMYCHIMNAQVIIDPKKVKRILINLIGNAFKFTHTGKIEVNCSEAENGMLLFYVADTGIGIHKEKQVEIFERFVQGNHGNSRLYGGTGLGLSIVEGLLGILGGKIWLESEPGKGSTFYFTIPYKIDKRKTDQPKVSDKQNCFPENNFTILIVEDDHYNGLYLQEVLSETPYTLLITETGEMAVEVAKNQRIDLILMDILLPGIDGYEATRLIKEEKPGMKIIAQTAYATPSDERKALEAGCDGYISKPISRIELLKKIELSK